MADVQDEKKYTVTMLAWTGSNQEALSILYHIFAIHLLFNGHLACFYFSAIINEYEWMCRYLCSIL